MAGALDGIRVLDLTWGTAALGVLLLAEQGADVIKVEPPTGDPFRHYEGYKVWTRSRRSVTVDLKSDAGRDAFVALAKTADVVVDSFTPGVMERLGIGSEALRAANPRLITCSVPAYPAGHRAQHRPGYDALVQAASGQQWEQPGWRAGPIFLPMPMPSSGMIWLVASGILAALHARESSGAGQHVQTSLLQGAWLYTTQIWQDTESGDSAYYGLMAKTDPPGVHQPMIFECADGWAHLSVMSGLAPKLSIDEILGLEPLPPETFEGLTPIQAHTIVANRQRDAIRTWKRDELVAVLVANNHAVEAIIEPEDQFSHPQLIANDMVVTVEDPELGTTTQLGVPVHLLRTPGAVTGGQPRVGEHDQAVWGEVGLTHAQIEQITAVPNPGVAPRFPAKIRSMGDPSVQVRALAEPGEARGPLAGLTLVDFGQYLAGPFGPMILGDLGMDVIKVEPVTGDGMRMGGAPFFGCQRGKRDIAINLKDPDGLALAMEIVAKADVVHHNMTKGTAARLGLDYEACRQANPDVIYCNTYAYGLNGPLSEFGGLDPLYQASAGLEYEVGGVQHGHQPLYYRFGMCDAANAMLSVVGVLAAIVHRDRTGEAQELWTSLMDGGAWHASDVLLKADGTPSFRPKVDVGQHGFGPEYRLYQTQDWWIQVAALKPEQWEALCATLDVPRDDDHWTLTGRLEAAFRTKTSIMWSRALDDAGVPNEVPIQTEGGHRPLYDTDAERLGLVVQYDHPIVGRMRQFGELINFSDTPARVFGPPPRVGEHTLEILAEIGRSGDAEALAAAGVVTWPDEGYAWGW
ncbi:MAG: CoA transferase [Actinobacteria bacterium]|nr:CoA transferase [Actinomycetota bacterium]